MSHGLLWYWHRLRSMNRAELRQRIGQKLRQRADARRLPDFRRHPIGPAAAGTWPVLPTRETVPEEFSEGLRHDARDILHGRWRAFGHVLLHVDDPPQWFMDYAARRDLTTTRSAFRINHRELPAGSDIKLVWELSRWHQLVRLAQAAWLLGDATAAGKVLEWLEHWRRQNPPYVGWNWTSALEAGLRLLNLAWIDALLGAAEVDFDRAAWDRLRERLLPPHVWFVSRHRSFGTSANNHLLGELAGLLAATARWPALERWGLPLAEGQGEFEREVLAQFAPDGGNREQALNYQLFSWELGWHGRGILQAAGRTVAPAVEERLRRAADFYVALQAPTDPWDYGDSDSAIAVPLAANEARAAQEWLEWLADPAGSPTLRWWLGDPPPPVDPSACVRPAGDWLIFPETGQAVCWSGSWQARWDLSPLGFLQTAAHGHLDALHLSLWLGGVALVIDPGTGAYYGDTRLRSWLASWAAHNGPQVPGVDSPRRLGPFLWGEHHPQPTWRVLDPMALAGELSLPHGTARREVRRLQDEERDGWQVEDLFVPRPGADGEGFQVCWQFAPGTRLEPVAISDRFFKGRRRGVSFTVGFDAAWNEVRFLPETAAPARLPVTGDLLGLCAPAFRSIDAGPVILLTARRANPSMYRTTFLVDREAAGATV